MTGYLHIDAPFIEGQIMDHMTAWVKDQKVADLIEARELLELLIRLETRHVRARH